MLVTAVEHQVMTTFRSFGLAGDGDYVIENLAEADVLACGGGLCVFQSGDSDHLADVRIEIWDTAPDPITGWDDADYGHAELDASEFERLALAVANDISVPIIGLPRIPIEPIRYRVEAWVTGRERSKQTHAYGATGLERWLVRLSPSQ